MEKKISSSKKCTDCKQKLPAEAFPAQSKSVYLVVTQLDEKLQVPLHKIF